MVSRIGRFLAIAALGTLALAGGCRRSEDYGGSPQDDLNKGRPAPVTPKEDQKKDGIEGKGTTGGTTSPGGEQPSQPMPEKTGGQ